MKIALLISGYLRSFKINLEKLKTNLINNNDVDIYIHITNNNETKYINNNINIDEIQKLLKPKIMIITDNFNINNIHNNIHNQNYKFYLLNKKRLEIEQIENIKYDIVIKFRPDIHLQQKIDFNIEPNTIYIPKDTKLDKNKLNNINDKYICDILAYGDPNIMNKYFDFYLHLNNLINKYGNINETLYYYYLNENNINYKLIDLSYIIILSLVNTIAISGDSGTGKTTLSNIIKKIFDNSFVLECDRYHKWERGHSNWDTISHLNPEANYLTKMNNDVFDLKIGNNIYQIDYDHKTGKFTDKEIIKSEDNIIVCGLHTLYMSDHIIDLKIYLDIADNIKIPWKIKRDVSKRGYTIDKILKQIESRKPDFIKYIYPQKFKADIIISLFNTDINIDYYNLDLNQEIKYQYKIGINMLYLKAIKNYENFYNNINTKKIKYEDNFIFLYFNDNEKLEDSIKNIIINFFNI